MSIIRSCRWLVQNKLSLLINVTLLLCFCVAGYAFTAKFAEHNDMDNFKGGLAGVSTYLPAGSTITIKCKIPMGEVYETMTRYFLAPVLIRDRAAAAHDSILVITPQGGTDSLVTSSHIIWQHKDAQYQYTLLSNP